MPPGLPLRWMIPLALQVCGARFNTSARKDLKGKKWGEKLHVRQMLVVLTLLLDTFIQRLLFTRTCLSNCS